MAWAVEYRKGARVERAVRGFRKSTKRAFYEAVKDLQKQGPYPKGWDTLEIEEGVVRLKIDYRHRMIYEVHEDVLVIKIIKVGTREGAYK